MGREQEERPARIRPYRLAASPLACVNRTREPVGVKEPRRRPGRTVDEGQKSFSTHSGHLGARATQTRRPCRIKRKLKPVHSGGGISFVTSASILTGSVLLVRPSRRVSRVTWVSTANPGMPKATPSTTLAVFRPTPGRVTRSSILGGTSPWNRSTRAALAAMMVFALVRKNPVGLIRASTARGSAWARAAASGYLANRTGVTAFTDRSVVCAERMVATSIWNGVLWSSSEIAG